MFVILCKTQPHLNSLFTSSFPKCYYTPSAWIPPHLLIASPGVIITCTEHHIIKLANLTYPVLWLRHTSQQCCPAHGALQTHPDAYGLPRIYLFHKALLLAEHQHLHLVMAIGKGPREEAQERSVQRSCAGDFHGARYCLRAEGHRRVLSITEGPRLLLFPGFWKRMSVLHFFQATLKAFCLPC